MSTNFEDLILRDTRANQPAASIPGRLMFVTDEGVWERDTGAAWEDVTEVGLTDYSSTSTVVGWAAGATKEIFYARQGNRVDVWVNLSGTSDSTSTTITLPFACNGSIQLVDVIRIRDNGTWGTGILVLSTSSSTVTFYKTTAAATWTASGTKTVQGQFTYYTS